jgi:hypothetical protein
MPADKRMADRLSVYSFAQHPLKTTLSADDFHLNSRSGSTIGCTPLLGRAPQ